MNKKCRDWSIRQAIRIIEGASTEGSTEQNRKNKTLVYGGIGLDLLDETADAYEELLRRLLHESDWGTKFSEKYMDKALRKLLCTLSCEENIESSAPSYIDALAAELDGYSEEHTTYIPVSGIEICGEPFEIGNVKLLQVSDDHTDEIVRNVENVISTMRHSDTEKEQLMAMNKAQIESLKGTVCAKFVAVAEPIKVRERAENECRRVFDLIRYLIPFLYPKGLNIQVGFQGEVFASSRITPTYSSKRFNLNTESVGPLTSFDVSPNNIEAMDQLGIFKVSEILQKSPNIDDFEGTLLRGLHWIADAQIQPERANRFLSLTTCLETFLTPKNREPIGNAIAEGVALLLGDSLEDRRKLKSRVKNLYGMRSAVSHGSSKDILDADLNDLTIIARSFLKVMIDRNSDFSSRDDLLKWIEDQKLR